MTTERLSARLVLGIWAWRCCSAGRKLHGGSCRVRAPHHDDPYRPLFASYALLDGLLSILAGARAARRVAPRSFMVLEGLVSIGTGVTAFILMVDGIPADSAASMAKVRDQLAGLKSGAPFKATVLRAGKVIELTGVVP